MIHGGEVLQYGARRGGARRGQPPHSPTHTPRQKGATRKTRRCERTTMRGGETGSSKREPMKLVAVKRGPISGHACPPTWDA